MVQRQEQHGGRNRVLLRLPPAVLEGQPSQRRPEQVLSAQIAARLRAALVWKHCTFARLRSGALEAHYTLLHADCDVAALTDLWRR